MRHSRRDDTRRVARGPAGEGPYACPCCKLPTLEARVEWEICRECGWEDDGQDDLNADEVWGGPNGSDSLTDARLRYAQYVAVARANDSRSVANGGQGRWFEACLTYRASRYLPERFAASPTPRGYARTPPSSPRAQPVVTSQIDLALGIVAVSAWINAQKIDTAVVGDGLVQLLFLSRLDQLVHQLRGDRVAGVIVNSCGSVMRFSLPRSSDRWLRGGGGDVGSRRSGGECRLFAVEGVAPMNVVLLDGWM